MIERRALGEIFCLSSTTRACLCDRKSFSSVSRVAIKYICILYTTPIWNENTASGARFSAVNPRLLAVRAITRLIYIPGADSARARCNLPTSRHLLLLFFRRASLPTLFLYMYYRYYDSPRVYTLSVLCLTIYPKRARVGGVCPILYCCGSKK